MKDNPLGKDTEYNFHYDAGRLFPIARKDNREALGIDASRFSGYDIWNAYELSWLNPKGKPEVRIAKIIYSAESEFIVESKSLKLYLNGYIMTKFESAEGVRLQIEKDLASVLNKPYIRVELFDHRTRAFDVLPLQEGLLDDLDIAVETYEPMDSLLRSGGPMDGVIERTSHLLKSNCPITGQPDWASVYIKYKADFQIEDASLLKYILSYRNHSGYHESCCEQIFTDLYTLLNPQILTVKCFFTRRGGIDINPIRSFGEEILLGDFHYFRQ